MQCFPVTVTCDRVGEGMSVGVSQNNIVFEMLKESVIFVLEICLIIIIKDIYNTKITDLTFHIILDTRRQRRRVHL